MRYKNNFLTNYKSLALCSLLSQRFKPGYVSVCGSGISNRKGAFYKQSIVDYKTNVCMRRFELIEMMLKY